MEPCQTVLENEKAEFIRRIRSHPFMAECRAGEITLEALKVFLVQQGLYSSYFTRYLCALMGNLSSNADILKLASNLCEELGLANRDDIPHSVLYRTTLEHFGLSIKEARPFVGTQRLIDTMFDHCRSHDATRELAALYLGAEALVPAVYADIITGLERYGVAESALHFFRLHIECDEGHAETLRELLLEVVRRDASKVPIMLGAGAALVDARLAFFSSIEDHRRQTHRTSDGSRTIAC